MAGTPAQAREEEAILDAHAVRSRFPILERRLAGDRRLAYLDNAATTQKPDVVIEAMTDYYETINANVHRSLHSLGEQATLKFENARGVVAGLVNAPASRHVVFTRGTTEAINLAAWGWGRKNVGPGDVVIVTEMEHHSNLVPWQQLAREKGATLRVIPVMEDGSLDLASYEDFLGPEVKLLAVTHVSNILGTVNPVKEMVAAAHSVNARVVVDAAQSVPHRPVDVQDLGCDFLAFSGHKLCGPTGIGVLFMAENVLDEMDPFMTGGEMIHKVSLTETSWAAPPHKFEAGTPPIAEAIGLGAAVTFLQEIGLEKIHRYEESMTEYAIDRLLELQGLCLYGPVSGRAGVLSFCIGGIHPHDVAQLVDRDGVAIRAGHGCAQPLMKVLGVNAVSRASLYLYNVREDIDALVASLIRARSFFNHGHG